MVSLKLMITSKEDFINLFQSYISQQFPNAMVTEIKFSNGTGKEFPVKSIQLSFKPIND